jgi:hypothetical protein
MPVITLAAVIPAIINAMMSITLVRIDNNIACLLRIYKSSKIRGPFDASGASGCWKRRTVKGSFDSNTKRALLNEIHPKKKKVQFFEKKQP